MSRIRYYHLFAIVFVGFFIIEFNVQGASGGGSIDREHKLYTAKNSSEAVMKFSHWVELKSKTLPTAEMSREQIEKQLTHLFGPMSANKYAAVPRGNHKLRIYKPKKVQEMVFRISYQYQGTIVLKNGPKEYYDILLPNNPDEIYQKGFMGELNPCTDEHYQSEGDFWYFWNPYQSGCPLQEGADFTKINAQIQIQKNEAISFPDYVRLVQSDDLGNLKIPIRIFLGMDEPTNLENPLDPANKDINAQTYLSLRNYFLKNSYSSSILNLANHSALTLYRGKPKGFLEVFKKILTLKNRKIEMEVQLYFGPTGIGEKSKTFHSLMKEALESSSMMIYDGHSGLGGHLDIASIEELEHFKIQFNMDQYQIFYFNSCSSYPYYNSMYFKQKQTKPDPQGTYNLDILTNGLATLFNVMNETNLAVIKAIEYWATGRASVSYQELARVIDSGNLFGINGDEDNPKTP